jgi:hypothetical protein
METRESHGKRGVPLPNRRLLQRLGVPCWCSPADKVWSRYHVGAMCLKNTLLTPNKLCACAKGFICVRLTTHTRAKNLSFMMSCMRCMRCMRSKAGFRRVKRFGKSGRRDDQFIQVLPLEKIPTWHALDFTTGF